MNARTLKILAAVAAGLVIILIAMEAGERGESVTGAELLLPGLRDRINDVESVTVTDAGGTITVRKTDAGWGAAERDGYPVDLGKLRELLLALADAKILEAKTANPELYDRLGVQDPDAEGSAGTRLRLTGPEFDYDLIVGDTAQRDSRYVRRTGEARSWLIDANPTLPDDASAWLVTDIVDIDTSRVRRVEITHTDERIRISKESPDTTGFTVDDIPEGRELSYAAVANGIGGALDDLTLDDVRAGGELVDADVVTEFETFDGLRLVARLAADDEGTWISLVAAAVQAAGEPGKEVDEAADEGVEEAAPAEEEEAVDPAAAAAALNERLSGWQFLLPDYKADQLTRRWEDLLKAEDAEGE